VLMPVADEEQRVGQQHFRRAGVSFEGQLIKALPAPASGIAEEFPAAGLDIRRTRVGAIFGAIPPLEDEVVRVGSEVAGVTQDDIFIKNVVRKNRLDGPA